ncbi:MAG: type 1 glutamine amidotransferase [Opitutae bacterium]|nr:type 1 glutamine amidotransferase [Opitutae bacterium]MBT4664944.1 type 1 glutamine amidotransferase [Opitutae bacterium]
MRVHWLQHVPFEGLGCMSGWFLSRGHDLSCTRLFEEYSLPDVDDFDWLVVMGGPMGVEDSSKYPWLLLEINLIQSAIMNGKRILGVCLGAQLMAAAMDAKVSRNPHKEIGWFPVNMKEGEHTAFTEDFPKTFEAFHWHGDTFDIPQGAEHLVSSAATSSQGFCVGRSALALQFHLELRAGDANRIAEACHDDLTPGTYVQQPEEFTMKKDLFEDANKLMGRLLETLEKE